MQIQVCRQCGNRNTVINKTVTNCNYCGSSDLEPMSETAYSTNDNAEALEKNKPFSIKLLISLIILLLLMAVFYWFWQNNTKQIQDDDLPVYPSFLENTANKKAPVIDSNNMVNSKQNTSENDSNITPIEDSQTVNLDVLTKTETNNLEQGKVSDFDSDKQIELIADAQEIKSQNRITSLTLRDSASAEDELQAQATNIIIKPVVPEPSVAIVLPDIPTQVNKVAKTNEIGSSKPQQLDISSEKQMTGSVEKLATIEKKAEIVSKPQSIKQEARLNEKASTQTNLAAKKPPETKPKTNDQLKPFKQAKPANQVTSISRVESNRARNAKRSLDRINGVVLDAETALMWMTCSLGQRWNGQACVGQSNEYLWSEAMNEAKQSSYAGYGDWRLPTRQELNSIVSCTSGRLPSKLDSKGKMMVKDGQQMNGQCIANFSRPTIDVNVFPNTERAFYWSYSHSAVNNYSVWGVFFSKGQLLSFNRSNVGFVRLVRSN